MAEDLEVRQNEKDPRAKANKLAARVAKNFEGSLKAKAALERAGLELTEAQPGMGDWEIFAFGPWQTPDEMPGRIIRKNQTAYLAIVVWMNPAMCRNITQHGDKIELHIFTSDMQRMEPAGDDLSHYCCIKTVLDHCWYVYVWEFTPTQDACLYETNICARICTCSDVPLQDYAGFVRHVYDFDPATLWPPIPATIAPADIPGGDWPDPDVPTAPPSWGFDRPVRFMVYDPDVVCECGDPNVQPNNFCEGVLSSPAED